MLNPTLRPGVIVVTRGSVLDHCRLNTRGRLATRDRHPKDTGAGTGFVYRQLAPTFEGLEFWWFRVWLTTNRNLTHLLR